MERYEFEMIPVPAEALNAVGITPGVTVEAFADGSRIVIQKAPGWMRKTHSVRGMMRTARVVPIAVPAAANA